MLLMTLVLSHPDLLKHGRPEDPEQPIRLETVLSAFKGSRFENLLDLSVERLASREELTLLHDANYVDSVLALDGKTSALDHETFVTPGSVRAARLAVGLSLEMVERIIRFKGDGKAENGFVLVRPPGHHAETNRAMGYCIFNNIGIAAKHALALGVQRVLILDWDVHHGNGTQHTFYSDDKVLFVDIHQDNLFPANSGNASETGHGQGLGYTLNIPLPHSCDQSVYLECLEDQVRSKVFDFKPQLILISAGFDAHETDPKGSMRVSTNGFAALLETIQAWANELCGGKLALFLEGGYEPPKLAENVLKCVEVLSTKAPSLKSVPDWPLGTQALGRSELNSEWMQSKLKQALALNPASLTAELIQSTRWDQSPGDPASFDSGFGLYTSTDWRRHVTATLLSDWVSYSEPSDRVSFDRLAYVMHAFPKGFRVWWVRTPQGSWCPVGYTGWYPMTDAQFELMENHPEKQKTRMIIPERGATLSQSRPLIYLFNYSVVPKLRKTCLTQVLMKTYSKEILDQNPRGLSCMTVSPDGERVANRFGMKCANPNEKGGEMEGIYIGRY